MNNRRFSPLLNMVGKKTA